MAHVVVDLGHKNCDSGAVANGFREVDLNNSIGNYCGQALRRCGVVVTYSTGTLRDRSNLCNKINPNCFVSIHNNAGGGDGTEVYTYTSVDTVTKNLAYRVYNSVVPKCNNGRGIKSANFHVLRETACPAILVECAFVDSKDVQEVDEEHERKAFGEAIAQGICQWLGVTYKGDEPKPQAKPQGETYYRVICGSFKDKGNAIARQKELEAKGFKGTFLEAFKK